MELAQVEDCQKRKTNKAPVAADKLHYLSLHDSGTLPQMNGAQSLNEIFENWNALEGLLNSLVNAFCGDPASEKKHTH